MSKVISFTGGDFPHTDLEKGSNIFNLSDSPTDWEVGYSAPINKQNINYGVSAETEGETYCTDPYSYFRTSDLLLNSSYEACPDENSLNELTNLTPMSSSFSAEGSEYEENDLFGNSNNGMY